MTVRFPASTGRQNKKQLIVGKGVSFLCSPATGTELTPNLTPFFKPPVALEGLIQLYCFTGTLNSSNRRSLIN
ncbi:hypothetical protein Q7C36_012903 [Tachysurus vachellii]|uniref:Uncharacterized protein n=1 Tax=Tachysurus vachellii TaxID=175792 RepID=A0AA88MM79_TACVA|nr:hypothetical protein Q7C36_012903 [Tachysurus vachellii]